MKNVVFFIVLFNLLFFNNCSLFYKIKHKKVNLSSNIENIIIKQEKYYIYLASKDVIEFLEKTKVKDDEQLLLLDSLKHSEFESLTIEAAENNLLLKDNLQSAVYSVLIPLLSEGHGSIYDRNNEEFVKMIFIMTTKGSYGGKQTHLKTKNDIIYTHVISM